MTTTEVPLRELYQADEVAWLDATVELIRFGNLEAIDFSNLEELLTSMARSERKETVGRLTLLIAHVLKWIYQPEKRSRSWSLTIFVQQRDLRIGSFDSKTLYNYAEEKLESCYSEAVIQAVKETSLPTETFPSICPLTLEQFMAFDADLTGIED